jgi:lycopene cyclase domain-containing protein
MSPHLYYWALLAFTFFGPLMLSFDKKVAFYTKWKYFFPGIFIVGAFFILWDTFFTALGVWGFNENYILNIHLGNLPLEEVLFFFIVPLACIFIYECLICYKTFSEDDKLGKRILQGIAIFLTVVAIFNINKEYTFWNFVFTATFIFFLLGISRGRLPFNANAFMVAFAISLVPFLLVNGVLTALPIVWYHPEENLGLRIVTIPFEDVFYGLLMMISNVTFYEWRRKRARK